MELLRVSTGLTISNIQKEISKPYAQIHRRIKKLEINNILEPIGKNPKLYKINLNHRYELIFYYVECPRCKDIKKIHKDQSTTTCNCSLTAGHKIYRFWITDDRIKDSKKIV